MSMPEQRRLLYRALTEWRDAGMPVETLADYIEGFVSAKIDEVLQARADNRRSHSAGAAQDG